MNKILSNGRVINLPYDKNTCFRVEQETTECKYFTIIDVVSVAATGETIALLENNYLGEDWEMLVILPLKYILWLTSNLSPKRKVFIPYGKILVENANNDIITELIDNGYIGDESEVELWSDKEINALEDK